MIKDSEKSCLYRKDSGVMAIEAMIGFIFFIFAMYALFSYIHLYMTQSKISHALMETCQSMALESYGNEKLAFAWEKAGTSLDDIINSFITKLMSNPSSENNFVTREYWTTSLTRPRNSLPDYQDVPYETLIVNLAQERFYAYIGGSQEAAPEVLEALGVSDLNFNGTKIDGDDLTIRINYKVHLLLGFSIAGKTEFATSQQVTCKMWK